MKIDFPCPVPENELISTERGDFCTHCAKEVVNIDGMSHNEVDTLMGSSQGICISTSDAKMLNLKYSIRKFALSLLIVFGGTLFKFADAQVEKNINTISWVQPTDASIGLMQIVIVNQDEDTLYSGVKLEVELPNGKSLEPNLSDDGTFWVELPAYAKGKSVTIVANRFGKKKTRIVYVSNMGEAISERIKFKVKSPKRMTGRLMGCPSF